MNNKPYTSNMNMNSNDVLKIDKISIQAQNIASEYHKSSLDMLYGCADDFIYILKRYQLSPQEFNDICDIVKNKLYNQI